MQIVRLTTWKLSLLAAVTSLGCASIRYKEVTDANTMAAYEQFIIDYPNNPLAKEAQRKLDALKAELANARQQASPLVRDKSAVIDSLGSTVSPGVEVVVNGNWKLAFSVPMGSEIYFYKDNACISCGGNITAFQNNTVRACITCAETIKLPRDFVLPIGDTDAVISGPQGATLTRKEECKEITLVDGDARVRRGQRLPPALSFQYSKFITTQVEVSCKLDGTATVHFEQGFITSLKADRSTCSVIEL